MRANMVVVLSPLIDFYSRLVQRSEPVRAQAFLAELAVEAFDERVLSRFSQLHKAKRDTRLLRPKEHGFAGDFVTVVAHHLLWWLPAGQRTMASRSAWKAGRVTRQYVCRETQAVC